MKIRLEYVAMLALPEVRSGSLVELPEGSTVAALLDHLKISAAHQRVVAAFVQDRRVHPGHGLRDGDLVFLGLPIGGG